MMVSPDNKVQKEVILMSGGVESTTMLHMRHRIKSESLKDVTLDGHGTHSTKDFLIPLFINYGIDRAESPMFYS